MFFGGLCFNTREIYANEKKNERKTAIGSFNSIKPALRRFEYCERLYAVCVIWREVATIKTEPDIHVNPTILGPSSCVYSLAVSGAHVYAHTFAEKGSITAVMTFASYFTTDVWCSCLFKCVCVCVCRSFEFTVFGWRYKTKHTYKHARTIFGNRRASVWAFVKAAPYI